MRSPRFLTSSEIRSPLVLDRSPPPRPPRGGDRSPPPRRGGDLYPPLPPPRRGDLERSFPPRRGGERERDLLRPISSRSAGGAYLGLSGQAHAHPPGTRRMHTDRAQGQHGSLRLCTRARHGKGAPPQVSPSRALQIPLQSRQVFRVLLLLQLQIVSSCDVSFSGDSGRPLPTLWLDGDWCFRVAPRNAFTRFVGFAYDATFTDDVRSPTRAISLQTPVERSRTCGGVLDR